MATHVRSLRSPKVEVRRTETRGRAIFAKESIAAGEMVFIKSGHIVDTQTAAEIDRTIGDYSMQISDDFFLAPRSAEEVENFVVYFNHSCEPNIGPRGQIEFVALRDIAAGEELCTDYAMTVDTSNRAPYNLNCNCGSRLCRKVITGLDWKLPELQARYGKRFSIFILEKILDTK
jgi:SET domain-containing protein